MTITVAIVRKPKGRLQAFVVQEGRCGGDLLADRPTHSVANARLEIEIALRLTYRNLEIEWAAEGPESDAVSVSDKPIQTARDRYGMKGVIG